MPGIVFELRKKIVCRHQAGQPPERKQQLLQVHPVRRQMSTHQVPPPWLLPEWWVLQVRVVHVAVWRSPWCLCVPGVARKTPEFAFHWRRFCEHPNWPHVKSDFSFQNWFDTLLKLNERILKISWFLQRIPFFSVFEASRHSCVCVCVSILAMLVYLCVCGNLSLQSQNNMHIRQHRCWFQDALAGC